MFVYRMMPVSSVSRSNIPLAAGSCAFLNCSLIAKSFASSLDSTFGTFLNFIFFNYSFKPNQFYPRYSIF